MVFPVRFVTHNQSVQSTSRDLDESSVFVRCVEPPEAGERVVVRLYLPGMAAGESLQAIVREPVNDGREAGFRAEFTDLTPENLEHLRLALAAGAAAQAILPETPARAGENRRLLPRYLDRFRVTVVTGQHNAQRESLNLSASGLFIQTDTPPAIDQIVQVVLELPDGQPPAEVQGIVLHRVLPGKGEPAGAGVQFIGAGDDFRTRLDDYLETLKSR